MYMSVDLYKPFFHLCFHYFFCYFWKGKMIWPALAWIWTPNLEQNMYLLNMFYLGKSPKNLSSYFGSIDDRMNQYDKKQPVP